MKTEAGLSDIVTTAGEEETTVGKTGEEHMGEKTEKLMAQADAHLIGVYKRFPVAFAGGKGMHLFDIEGKDYLDFASGIGVNAFGANDEAFTDAICEQVKQVMHTSNLYYHEPLAEAAARLAEVSGLDRVFFTNSGAEAIEGALKTAKRYYFNRTGKNDDEVIAMNNSFHGRTVGSLSVTGTDAYRNPFYPLMGGVSFADFNDLASVEAAVTERTCAIIFEPVQGEGGIHPATAEFMEGVRKLCDEKGILLIFDEIQCGLGRTGSFYTFQQYGVTPDILTTAKALGGGLPVGAFVVTEKVAENSLKPGDHGSTYGGNPLCTRAVAESLKLLTERDLPGHVRTMTPCFEGKLDEMVQRFPFVKEHRGMGYMQGLQLDPSVPAGQVVSEALSQGLILLTAVGNVVRMLPPLIAEEKDFNDMADILTAVFEKF